MSPVHKATFYRRVEIGVRTGVSSLLCAAIILYHPLSHWLSSPFFAQVLAVVSCDSTLGTALHNFVNSLLSVILSVPLAALLHTCLGNSYAASMTSLAISCFFVACMQQTPLLARKVALALNGLMYLTFLQDESTGVSYAAGLAGTTMVGSTCAVVAMALPWPSLSHFQVNSRIGYGVKVSCALIEILTNRVPANVPIPSVVSPESPTEATAGNQWESVLLPLPMLLNSADRNLRELKQYLPDLPWEPWGWRHLEGAVKPLDKMLTACQGMHYAIQQQQKEVTLKKVNALVDFLPIDAVDIAVPSLVHSLAQIGGTLKGQEDHSGGDRLPTLSEVSRALKKMTKLKKIVSESSELTVRRHDMFLFCLLQFSEAVSDLLHATDAGNHPPFCSLPIQLAIMAEKQTNIVQCMQSMAAECRNWTPARLTSTAASIWSSQQFWAAIKVMLSCVLAAVIGTAFNPAFGFWAVVTVGFIIAGNRGGVFKTGYLRLQGTVAGSIYGYLSISVTSRYNWLLLLPLVPWVAFTSYLRQNPRYGYAGVVAAFTAGIIMLGYQYSGQEVQQYALDRITQTFVGVLCYVTVEALVFPVRATLLLRLLLVQCLARIRDLVSTSGAEDGLHPFSPASLLADINVQVSLIAEAAEEPTLWNAPFPADVYNRLCHCQKRMLRMIGIMDLAWSVFEEYRETENNVLEGVVSVWFQACRGEITDSLSYTLAALHRSKMMIFERRKKPLDSSAEGGTGAEQFPGRLWPTFLLDHPLTLMHRSREEFVGLSFKSDVVTSMVQEGVIYPSSERSNEDLFVLHVFESCMHALLKECRELDVIVRDLFLVEHPIDIDHLL